MTALLHLLQCAQGERSLTLYVRDGWFWTKRGQLKVTPELLEAVRRAAAQERGE